MVKNAWKNPCTCILISEIKFSNKFLIRFYKTLGINLTLTQSKDIGLQFFINLLPRSFFFDKFCYNLFEEDERVGEGG